MISTMQVSAPLDYSTSVQRQEEEEEGGRTLQLEHHQFNTSSLPPNLATSQHATVIQVFYVKYITTVLFSIFTLH